MTGESENGGEAPAPRSAPEESLDEALDSLERMLDEGAGPAPARPLPAVGEDGQYDIPLLQDVVVAGSAPPESGEPGPPAGDPDEAQTLAGEVDTGPGARGAPVTPPLHADALDDEFARKVVARLASEIDVIVQSRLEAALETARREIRAQVRDHIEITLPELVDELAAGYRSR